MTAPDMTLLHHILSRIAQNGPMTLAEYMGECLLHPTLGYYSARDPFGAGGDFTTAPEISQMFGEMLGLSLAQAWLDQGSPARFTLAELGPGRGTLMADILRATRNIAGFGAAAELHLVEASQTLRALQREKMPRATFHDSTETLPDAPLFLVANEFFDALPIRQFIRQGDGWCERLIGADGDALTFGLGPQGAQTALSHRLNDTNDGDLVETCPAAAPIAHRIGGLIQQHGGAALIVDYGDWHSLGDTLQALSQHKTADPLARPGMADLTAHVDFEPLAQATPCAHSLLCPQGVFLERLGITARAQALASKMQGDMLNAHIAAHRRLTHPQEMGTLFKVLGLFPQGAMPPPGLEPATVPNATEPDKARP